MQIFDLLPRSYEQICKIKYISSKKKSLYEYRIYKKDKIRKNKKSDNDYGHDWQFNPLNVGTALYIRI